MSRVVSRVFGILLGVVALCLLFVGPTHAAEHPPIVVALVQVGDSQSANNEVIEIYNNGDQPYEITNWCLYYASATSTTNGTKLACVVPMDALDHVFVPGHGYLSFVSKEYAAASSIVADGVFSAGLSATAGHVRLVDAAGTLVDKVAWGVTAVSPETLPASVPTPDTALSRVMTSGVSADTDNNSVDFKLVPRQLSIPNHQLYDQEDACGNIDGIQVFVPDDMVVDTDGNCTLPVVDVCANLLGAQATVPVGYELRADGLCWRIVAPLRITEVLPNPVGADSGNEFIELYNSSSQDVPLAPYILKVGQNLESTYKFSHGEVVPAQGYAALSSATYSFSLLNSSDAVALGTIDGQAVDSMLPYVDPGEGDAWALIDGSWQYTSEPTPGAPNILLFDSVDSDMAGAGVALAPCAANQYRNPATGRCKLLAGQSSTLVPCKDDQYRSEETGRCRTIVAASAPASCPTGQERNADTGRCRKIVSTTPPKANYAVLGASSSKHPNYILLAILGVLGLGVVYAIWEWHEEIAKLWHRLRRSVRIVNKHD